MPFLASRPSRTPLGSYLKFSSKASAPPVSTATTAMVYFDGTNLQASLAGGAYSAIITAGGSPTFTSPVTITTNTAPALTSNCGATTGNWNLIQANGTPTATGTITGLAIDLTGVTGGLTNMVQGLAVTGPATTAAKAAGSALAVFNSRATRAKIAAFRGRNVSSLKGSMVSIDWDQATTLTGQTVMLTLDADNADASTNNVSFCGAVIGAPVTTDATATTATAGGVLNVLGTSALTLFSRMTAATVLDVVAQNTSGTIAAVRYPSGLTTAIASEVVGLDIDLASNASITSAQVTGLRVTVPATTRANGAGEGAITVFSYATAARALDLSVRNTSGTLVGVQWEQPTTLAGATTMLSLDLGTNVTPGTQTVTLIDGTIPSNAGANASQGYKVTRSGAATATGAFTGNLLNLQNTPTGGAGGVTLTENGVLLNINHAPIAGATAITDTTTGIRCTLTPSTVNSTGLRGLDLLFGANVTGGTLASFAWNGSATLSAATTLLSLDTKTNVTQGGQTSVALAIAPGGIGLRFTAANDGSAYLLGPAADDFRVTAGLRTTDGAGRALTLTGGAAVTSGLGGDINLVPGAGAGGSAAGKINCGLYVVYQPELKDYTETVQAVTYVNGGTTTINLQNGNVVTSTVSVGVSTWAVSNVPASGKAHFTLILTNGGLFAQTWMTTTIWPGGVVPGLTAAGIDVLDFFTVNGGTTWYGFLVGQDQR